MNTKRSTVLPVMFGVVLFVVVCIAAVAGMLVLSVPTTTIEKVVDMQRGYPSYPNNTPPNKVVIKKNLVRTAANLNRE